MKALKKFLAVILCVTFFSNSVMANGEPDCQKKKRTEHTKETVFWKNKDFYFSAISAAIGMHAVASAIERHLRGPLSEIEGAIINLRSRAKVRMFIGASKVRRQTLIIMLGLLTAALVFLQYGCSPGELEDEELALAVDEVDKYIEDNPQVLEELERQYNYMISTDEDYSLEDTSYYSDEE